MCVGYGQRKETMEKLEWLFFSTRDNGLISPTLLWGLFSTYSLRWYFLTKSTCKMLVMLTKGFNFANLCFASANVMVDDVWLRRYDSVSPTKLHLTNLDY